MLCKNCPTNHPAVAKPPVSCKGKCGQLITWFKNYCTACSNRLKKCEDCGKKSQ